MKKKIKISLFVFMICLTLINRANAETKNDYYTNYYGINIPTIKYNELKKYYTDSYIFTMNEQEYENIMKNNLKDISISEITDNTNINFCSTLFSTKYKTIKIINNSGYITISLVWKIMPKIRSYDVIAARLNGVSISGAISFKQTYIKDGSTNISYSSTRREFDNGVGFSFKLSEYENLEISLSFQIKGNGNIYASYQHATNLVTLSQSKQYSLSSIGYGNVILFDNSVKNYYDAMSGVSISV